MTGGKKSVSSIKEIAQRSNSMLIKTGLQEMIENVIFQATKTISQIIEALVQGQLFRHLSDPDSNIFVETLGSLGDLLSLRDLLHVLSKKLHSDGILSIFCYQIIQDAVDYIYRSVPTLERVYTVQIQGNSKSILNRMEQELADGCRNKNVNIVEEFRYSSKYLGMTKLESPLLFRFIQEYVGEKQEKALLTFRVRQNRGQDPQLVVTCFSQRDDHARIQTLGTIENVDVEDGDNVNKEILNWHFTVVIRRLRESQQNGAYGKAPRMYEYDPRIFIEALRQIDIEVTDLEPSQNEELLSYQLHFPSGCRMVISVPVHRPTGKQLETHKE